jgi:hypothetical protein
VVALCNRMQTSTHTGPMLRINCPIFQPHSASCLALDIPFFPHPSKHANITVYDDINMPESSSVGNSTFLHYIKNLDIIIGIAIYVCTYITVHRIYVHRTTYFWFNEVQACGFPEMRKTKVCLYQLPNSIMSVTSLGLVSYWQLYFAASRKSAAFSLKSRKNILFSVFDEKLFWILTLKVHLHKKNFTFVFFSLNEPAQSPYSDPQLVSNIKSILPRNSNLELILLITRICGTIILLSSYIEQKKVWSCLVLVQHFTHTLTFEVVSYKKVVEENYLSGYWEYAEWNFAYSQKTRKKH